MKKAIIAGVVVVGLAVLAAAFIAVRISSESGKTSSTPQRTTNSQPAARN